MFDEAYAHTQNSANRVEMIESKEREKEKEVLGKCEQGVENEMKTILYWNPILKHALMICIVLWTMELLLGVENGVTTTHTNTEREKDAKSWFNHKILDGFEWVRISPEGCSKINW